MAAASTLLVGCKTASDPSLPPPSSEARLAPRFDRSAPNIVVIETDDQATDTMGAMVRTRRLLAHHGTTFDNAITSFPLCCPSRASFLTGQYAHNHGVLDNSPPNGGIAALDQSETLAVWLRRAGYRTAFLGKYLNEYGKEKNGGPLFIPPGWTDWTAFGSSDKTSAYNYSLNRGGRPVDYGNATADYKTAVMSRLAERSLTKMAADPRPFFFWVTTSDPHLDDSLGPRARRNPLPYRDDLGLYKGATPPPVPSFNEKDVSDKSGFVRELDPIDQVGRLAIRRTWVSQLESLVEVDRLVAAAYGAIADAGELRRTLIVFTSDNGFLRGQHRIDSGKSSIFEEALKVPLIIAGPGFEGASRRESTIVSNVDLSATILHAAGVRAPIKTDGIPIQRTLERGHRSPILLEIYGRKDGDLFGVRSQRYTYAEHSDGFVELYDLEKDPYELSNVAERRPYRTVQAALQRRLDALRSCAGATCRNLPRRQSIRRPG